MSAGPTSSKASTRKAEQCIGLDVLLVTGQRQTWIFDPDATVCDVKTHIASHWPKDWPEVPQSATDHMRLLHLGFFWENDDATLRDLNLPPRRTTVIHLVIRPALAVVSPTDNSEPKSTQPKSTKGLRCFKLFRRHDDAAQAGSNKRHSATSIGSASTTA
ncbi:hypothetical protein OC846_004116 [Tilletia horrida]|uniref:UBL3-like ubiquitin domain-containing protein n=1 Tax=Tilletia horrida TaxID=155126 RepID=A0AAN6JQQ0_9BASI|nr:hypothetical protein OC846_004116 [Tilletia horrida]KAK0564471.1 hypothetical protein OC861_004282 [Tilletia horrida]